tara:strand:- start:15 stop:572 length:558 start_codon:yes stop_codon:yes gene_type:complete
LRLEDFNAIRNSHYNCIEKLVSFGILKKIYKNTFVRLRNYFVNSLKTALLISKIGFLKKKIVINYNFFGNSKEIEKNKLNSNQFKKFHSIFYRNHILDLANDLSSQEQEVASEIFAETEIDYSLDKDIEDETLNNIEDLIEPIKVLTVSSTIPIGSSVKKIIVNKGRIVEKVFLTNKNEKIQIFY